MTSHVENMVPEERKKIPIFSSRLSTTAQRTRSITRARNVKIRIPWWNELISKEESEMNEDEKNEREDLRQKSGSKMIKHDSKSEDVI